MDETLLENLLHWLRIPSISTGGGDPAEIERAAQFVVDRVREAGGEGDLVRIGAGNPIAVCELRAQREDAPTVLLYGHYDVQSPEPLGDWDSPPFEPEIRDGRLYARGASDDKGNVIPVLHAACELARAGELPVHVRVVIEGEEEVGGASFSAWTKADTRGADCAIVFDSAMEDEQTPAICLGLRGIVAALVEVRTQPRELHSGLYGGSVLNAAHVLHKAVGRLLPDDLGRVRDELREGVADPSAAERASWAALRPGEAVLEEVGATPLHPGAGAEYRVRNGAEPSAELNWFEAGEARTIVPATARAYVTVRLAPGQRSERIREVVEGLLREQLPQGAQMTIGWHLGDPALFPPEEPAIRIAAAAIERATGMAPVFVRSGGSIPAVADLAAKGIPVIVSGFALAQDRIHAPNESYRLASLELGARAGRELLLALADLPRG
ncbi:unannotated protein [freshwater metagenome]|uniref:Unannotated protein n=1 Tax=freshwater metagenome TaxID=449393 RepID=A0A6J7IRR3_9ZZZZ